MRNVTVVALLLSMLLLVGCWDMREINEIGFVMAIGIDKAAEPGQFTITVQIANPSANSSKAEESAEIEGIWVATAQGPSIFDAIRQLVRISSRRIVWAHNNLIVIGEPLARESITPVIDFFTHNPELRMKTNLVIAKGNAREYLYAKAGMEQIPAISLSEIIRYQSLTAESVISDMLRVAFDYNNQYLEPLISAVSLKKVVITPEDGNAQAESETIELAGAAVFKKDRTVGWLSPEETRGVAWALNETRNTVVTVTDHEHQNKNVSVETHNVKSEIISEVEEGLPRITINISGAGSIVEEDGTTNLAIDEMKDHIEDLINNKIVDEIVTSINKLQEEYNSDVLNFAKIVHSQNNEEWEETIKYNWQDIFPQIPVTVMADININTSTLYQEPRTPVE